MQMVNQKPKRPSLIKNVYTHYNSTMSVMTMEAIASENHADDTQKNVFRHSMPMGIQPISIKK